MGKHPLNLGLRFLLELAALFAMGYWGWTQHTGLARFLWAVGLPLVFSVAWGTFRVPGDPGPAPVAVPGVVRLLLETVFFGVAVWSLYASGRESWALVLGLLLLIQYGLSYDRILWMIRREV